MTRIFGDYAYSSGPRDGCWWDETVTERALPPVSGAQRADVCVIGGGFTGLNAALRLVEAGRSVTVIDAEFPGWGASGRNGGFCCLGGARISHKALTHRYGEDAARAWWQTEKDAIAHVAALLDRHGIDADTHSRGETQLAHSPRAMDRMRHEAEALAARGIPMEVIEMADLPGAGMAGPWHGAVAKPVGFALNPRRYIEGLVRACEAAGASVHAHSPATALERSGDGWRVTMPGGHVDADRVVVATNGYSHETLPRWMGGRYMPAQSTVIVTRPLSDDELAAAGWTTDQMSYDSRNLLHYFRLMPDRRFLIGARGGLISSPGAEARARRSVRRDFEKLFPAWSHVETPYQWSGMVCLSSKALPYAGPVPDMPGVFAAFAYHGNGVAMGSHAGALLAGAMLGEDSRPAALAAPPGRFPFGRARRVVMPPLYIGLMLGDL
jgi:glycine/D-amino acid oxidase-like deaminating enzyme